MIQADRKEQLVVREFVRAVKQGDRAALVHLLGRLDDHILWQRAFRALVREVDKAKIDPEMQATWLRIWISRRDQLRDQLRQEADKGLLLARALRILLPPYTGPSLTLFRGDSARNRRCRSYGPSWSSNQAVAESHAEGFWRKSEGGSVLLSTFAAAQAIICAPWQHDDRYAEDEYLVDRSWLKGASVTEVQRYSQVTRD